MTRDEHLDVSYYSLSTIKKTLELLRSLGDEKREEVLLQLETSNAELALLLRKGMNGTNWQFDISSSVLSSVAAIRTSGFSPAANEKIIAQLE